MVEGQDKVTGKFLPGNQLGKGRRKGSRNKMTQQMLDRVAGRSEDGLSMEEILMDIAQDPDAPSELRFKAASKVADLVFPKAASVEVKIDDEDKLSKEQIDQRLSLLLKTFIANDAVKE
ncbi:MAG: hypothetical protein ACRC6V_02510 [Bacteroidales bacterium]